LRKFVHLQDLDSETVEISAVLAPGNPHFPERNAEISKASPLNFPQRYPGLAGFVPGSTCSPTAELKFRSNHKERSGW
jgi:hypothetical protein